MESVELEGMTLNRAREVNSEAVRRSFEGHSAASSKFFRALRVINVNKARELYKSLSKELINRGIASDKLSELEELYRIGDVSIRDHSNQQEKINKLEKELKNLKKGLSYD